jgi:CheY-like chemotaxis protein
MVQPLALVLYEKLLPGTQLVNRLQDLNYRVRAVNDPAALVACAELEKPMVVIADLYSRSENVPQALAQLRQNPNTGHIPILAFAPERAVQLQEAGRAAGAALVASEAAIVTHLPQFLEQALQLE